MSRPTSMAIVVKNRNVLVVNALDKTGLKIRRKEKNFGKNKGSNGARKPGNFVFVKITAAEHLLPVAALVDDS